MLKRHTILPTRTGFFISSAGKSGSVLAFKKGFLGSGFIAGDNHIAIKCLHIVIFNKHDI